MSWKRTLLLTLVLLSVSGVYFFRSHHPALTERRLALAPEIQPPKILSLKTGERIEHLTLHNQLSHPGTMTFERSGDNGWEVVAPIRFPASPLVVSGFGAMLKALPRARMLLMRGVEESELGFDQPRIMICIKTNRKPDERCLLVGSPTVIGDGAYAKWRHEDKYFLVNQNLVDALDKSLYTVRKKQIFSLFDADIHSIQAQLQDEELVIQREKDSWFLTQPTESAIGQEAMHELLTEISGLHIKDFLDSVEKNVSELGLRPAQRSIVVRFRDGALQKLVQGSSMPGRDGYYVRTHLGKTLLLVSKGKLDSVGAKLRALNA